MERGPCPQRSGGSTLRPHSEKSVPCHIYCIKAHKEDFSEWVPEDEHAISVVRVVRHRPQRYEQHHLFQRKKRKKAKKEKNRTKNKNLSQTKRKQNLDKKEKKIKKKYPAPSVMKSTTCLGFRLQV